MIAPRVSVCMAPRRENLMTARASALGQDVGGVEVIVVDDGSVDATSDRRAAMDDPRQRRRRLPPGRPRRATPAALARGEYVAWIDADDELLPGAHWRRAELFSMRLADIALVHGGQERIGADGRRLPGSGIARNALTIAMRDTR
jgi:glycosyltransferase involved in cell wall biosynthesis